MKVLELFAGTRSIGKAFEARGHEVFSIDWNADFDGIDLVIGGTQYALSESVERSRIPDTLCNHIVDICEGIITI